MIPLFWRIGLVGAGLSRIFYGFLSPLRRALDPPAGDKLCIFRRDPIVLTVTNLRLRWYSLTIIFIIVLITPKLVISGIDHTLTSPDLLSDFKHDLTNYPPFSAILDAISRVTNGVGLGDPFASIRQEEYQYSSAFVPYLRDYTDMFFIMFLSSHLALIFSQWRRISAVLDNLNISGFNKEIIGETELKVMVADNNKRFNNPLLQIVAIAGVRWSRLFEQQWS
jgi:hypothetical protein